MKATIGLQGTVRDRSNYAFHGYRWSAIIALTIRIEATMALINRNGGHHFPSRLKIESTEALGHHGSHS
jgi:hypothetical protein